MPLESFRFLILSDKFSCEKNVVYQWNSPTRFLFLRNEWHRSENISGSEQDEVVTYRDMPLQSGLMTRPLVTWPPMVRGGACLASEARVHSDHGHVAGQWPPHTCPHATRVARAAGRRVRGDLHPVPVPQWRSAQPGEPRRQAALRRPALQLQQAGQTRAEHHRPSDCEDKAQAVTTNWCGEYSLVFLLSLWQLIHPSSLFLFLIITTLDGYGQFSAI